MDRDQKVRRAKELLDDVVLNEALDAIEMAELDLWKSTTPQDSELRELCWYRLQAVQALRDELRSVARGLEVEAYNMRIKNRAK